MALDHRDVAPKYLSGKGVEIGAFNMPIPGISPIYVDRFAEYAGEPTLAEYYGDACDLPFYDGSLDYVAASHVIEHVANPLAALREWHRVLGHGGYIYMVVPDRTQTFDRPRNLTPVSHMLGDLKNGVTQSDGTHIDDFVYGVDWGLFAPATPPAQERASRDELAASYNWAVAAGMEINIHFHTFDSASMVELLAVGNSERIWEGRFEVVEVIERFPSSRPDGFLVVARAHKPLRMRWRALFAKTGLRHDARKLSPAEPVSASAVEFHS